MSRVSGIQNDIPVRNAHCPNFALIPFSLSLSRPDGWLIIDLAVSPMPNTKSLSIRKCRAGLSSGVDVYRSSLVRVRGGRRVSRVPHPLGRLWGSSASPTSSVGPASWG